MHYKQPRYFSGFQCIGGKCPNNCCHGWNISWKKEEIDNVLNTENIQPELHELVENSFILGEKEDDGYLIKLEDSGKCPFQTEEGLCKIQKELGAQYLSHTCMVYPRSSLHMGDVIYRFCRMSCPVIISQLFEYKKSMDLVTASAAKDIGKIIYPTNNIGENKKHPEQKYRDEIFDFFYELISDKNIETDDAILLGSLAAEALSQLVSQARYDLILDEVAMLRREIRTPDMTQSVKDVEPNVPIKILILSQIVEQLSKEAATTGILHNKDRSPKLDLYEQGKARLSETLKKREYFLRNIALQLLLELDIPFGNADKTIMENYALFETVYACIKLNLTAAMSTEEPITIHTPLQDLQYEGDRKLTGITAMLSRAFCQSPKNAKKTIEQLTKTGYDKPPNLALLVK